MLLYVGTSYGLAFLPRSSTSKQYSLLPSMWGKQHCSVGSPSLVSLGCVLPPNRDAGFQGLRSDCTEMPAPAVETADGIHGWES